MYSPLIKNLEVNEHTITLPWKYFSESDVYVTLNDIGLVQDIDYTFVNDGLAINIINASESDSLVIERKTNIDWVGYGDTLSNLTVAQLANLKNQFTFIVEESNFSNGIETVRSYLEDLNNVVASYLLSAEHAQASANAAQSFANVASGVLADVLLYRNDIVRGVANVENYIPQAQRLIDLIQQEGAEIFSQGVNVKTHGAQGDDTTDDTQAFYDALSELNLAGGGMLVLPKGIYKVTDFTLFLLNPIGIEGEGVGDGYTHPQDYIHNTTIKYYGTGEQVVYTRSRHRASSSDPQDPATSAAILIASEGCRVSNVTIECQADYTDFTNTYARANYSFGILNQGRCQVKIDNVHIIGPFSVASYGADATRATNMNDPIIPSFLSSSDSFIQSLPEGRLPRPDNRNIGLDGNSITNLYTYGGRWGVALIGPEPKDGEIQLSGIQYYDEDQAALVSDFRNGIGASDFDLFSCSIYGGDQHNGYRWSDITVNPALTDMQRILIDGNVFTGSGAYYNSAIEMSKMRHYAVRFSSSAPFRVFLRWSSYVSFIDCHADTRGFVTRRVDGITRDVRTTTGLLLKDVFPDGSGGVDASAATYGDIAKPPNTIATTFVGGTLNPEAFGGRFYTFDRQSTIQGNTSGISYWGKSYIYEFTEFRIESPLGIRIKSNADIDLQGLEVRLRYNTSTRQVTRDEDTLFYSLIRPNQTNTHSLGAGNSRWTEVYASNGAINTSDRRLKQDWQDIPDEWIVAWADVKPQMFKYKDSVAEKGWDNARWHFGYIAQDVKEAFEAHNLDPFACGLLCYDEWNQETMPAEEQGNPDVIVSAGNTYSLRYDQCAVLNAALTYKRFQQCDASTFVNIPLL